MKNTSIFCLTLNPDHIKLINELTYIPVGLGEKKFSKDFLTDKIGEEISTKNPFYGEYTFHYWIWKNHISNIKTKWVGFCQYRKFWSMNFTPDSEINIHNLKNKVLREIPDQFNEFEVILGDPFFVNKRKIMKFIKKGLPLIISKPQISVKER